MDTHTHTHAHTHTHTHRTCYVVWHAFRLRFNECASFKVCICVARLPFSRVAGPVLIAWLDYARYGNRATLLSVLG